MNDGPARGRSPGSIRAGIGAAQNGRSRERPSKGPAGVPVWKTPVLYSGAPFPRPFRGTPPRGVERALPH